MNTATFVHLAAACGLLVVSIMTRVGFGQDYTVRPFEAAQPTAWYPEPLKELGLHWTSFVAESLCKNYLILGAHEPGELDRCEYIVYDVVNNAVVNRVPLEAAVELLDYLSRFESVAWVGDHDALDVRIIDSMGFGYRDAYPHATRLRRFRGTNTMAQLERSRLFLDDPGLSPLSSVWSAANTVDEHEEVERVLVAHARYSFAFDSNKQRRWALPQVVVRERDPGNGTEPTVSLEWTLVGAVPERSPIEGIGDMHGVLSLASQRVAGCTKKGINGLGVPSRQPDEIRVWDAASGARVHAYVLRGKRDFNVADVFCPVVMGASPDGQFACFAVADPYHAGSLRVLTDVRHAVLLVRLVTPWSMEIMLTPREPQRILWPADGHTYLVVSQPFLGADVRPGGLEQPPVYRVSLEFMNR